MPEVTYSPERKSQLMREAIAARYDDRLTWEKVAARIGVARSTLQDWRETAEWRELERRRLRIIREEARGESAQILAEAMATLYELMKASRSDYVRFMAAQKLIDLNQVGEEHEERIADAATELIEFTKKQMALIEERRRLAAPEQVTVLPGGLLPPELQAANERYRRRQLGEAAEDEIVEASFTHVTNPPRLTDSAPATDSLDVLL